MRRKRKGKMLFKKLQSIIGACLLFSALPTSAALFDRGGGLIYDDVLNVTWMQNTNPLFEPPVEVCPPEIAPNCFFTGGSNGLVTFEAAKSYVDTLEFYDAVRDVTYDDWRLPTISPVNGVNLQFNNTLNGTSDQGNALTTTDGTDGGWRDGAGTPVSEMGYMFYVNLANTAGSLTNTGPFLNIEAQFSSSPIDYWTGTLTQGLTDAAYFNFKGGFQGLTADTEASGNPDYMSVWAVREGDVISSVPVPAAVWLFGSGLIGLIGVTRRKKS
jgi:hypothetical protein